MCRSIKKSNHLLICSRRHFTPEKSLKHLLSIPKCEAFADTPLCSTVHTYWLSPIFHSCLLLFQSFSASSSLTCITVVFPSLFTLCPSPCQCVLSIFPLFLSYFRSFFFIYLLHFPHPSSVLPSFPSFVPFFLLKEHKVKGLKAQVQTEIQKAEKAAHCM